MDKTTILSDERKQAEEVNCKLKEDLEQLVKSRTAGLENEIIQRKQAEEGVIQQQEFSRALLESMADGVVACDAEGGLVLFNRTAKEWHGMDPMRLPSEEWAKHYDLFQSDGTTPLPTEEIPLARAFKGEIVVDAGMAIVVKGQAPRFILANGSVIRDESGTNLGAVVVMRDVTELRRVEEALRKANEELESAVAARTSELEATLERLTAELEDRKQAEEALETERKRMEVLLSALNTGLSLINPDMTIAWVNRKIREMFPGREPVGQVCHLFYESRETICEGCGTVRAFMDGKVCESEQLVPTTGRWYYIVSQPIKDPAGRVVNVLEGITDITERKLAEQKLQNLNEELELRVRERTAELEGKNAELERTNRLFVGRELRMVELKERIRELEGNTANELLKK
jgi:PAS domain-containing protein